MNKKIPSIICCMVMIVVAVLPHIGALTSMNATKVLDQKNQLNLGSRDWELQWTHAYGGNGEAEFAQPIGDIDGDGVNEIIIGGYETTSMARIIHYDPDLQTYVQEYSWSEAGGVPSGASIADLNQDGSPLLIVSWAYSSADGVYAYKYDGTSLTKLDYYHGTGVDFVFDVYACDYNDDGALEIMIANAPNMGTGNKHVTALGWDIANQKFSYEASWSCPGGASMECPMVWSGDVDNDGLTEVIADVSSDTSGTTAGTWALNWNAGDQSWDGVPVWTSYGGATPYGDGVGDINGDGTPEIGTGSNGGTPQGWLFEWDGSTYQKVWNGQYPGELRVIESVALGDADNDHQNEFCFATGDVHIIGWNGTGYYEKATLTDPTGYLAGMNIGDCDTDGKNELKGCEILSGTGSEFIWKYKNTDDTPPVTTYHLNGQMNGDIFTSNVTVTLSATDDQSGVYETLYKLDAGAWTKYTTPFMVSTEGLHVLSFYSSDNAGNIEPTNNVSFRILFLPDVTITVSGGKGVSLTVTNNGTTPITNLPWSIQLTGKHLFKGMSINGTIVNLDSGKATTVTDPVFGFGRITVTVNVGGVQKTSKGFVILIFVLGVK
ncbi:MAG TPA: hypothetical protein VMT57_03355 [Candidatus Thermoplasmatota archaeon]|nr:hypothetical protein [Candidatus Thermoplasmatota archaeon]